jgi:hypothetical protein
LQSGILPGAFSISPFQLGVDATSILMYDGDMSYTTEMHHLGFTIMNERTALALSTAIVDGIVIYIMTTEDLSHLFIV